MSNGAPFNGWHFGYEKEREGPPAYFQPFGGGHDGSIDGNVIYFYVTWNVYAQETIIHSKHCFFFFFFKTSTK